MLTERRGFFGVLVGAAVAWLGFNTEAKASQYSWLPMRLERLKRYGDGAIIVTPQEKDGSFDIFLYTPRYKYVIHAKPTYLGASVVLRDTRLGHAWRWRLADGKLTEETWNRIMDDIVSYEMRF